jgi:hypothetical protein
MIQMGIAKMIAETLNRVGRSSQGLSRMPSVSPGRQAEQRKTPRLRVSVVKQ